MFLLKCLEIDTIPIINKYYFCVLNSVSRMNVNWNLFKIIFRGEIGGGGGVQIGKFQRGDNSCIGHHSFKCVFVASFFLALKSENEKLDILVFWGLSIKDASSVYTASCLQILGDVIMTVKEVVCLDVSSSLTSLSLTNSLSL